MNLNNTDSQNPAPQYRGRFAPSPTGLLHFGSLVTAVGSYLQAKSQQGEWLLRIDDIDPPREQSGATANILKTLEAFGFEWNGEVLYQSHNHLRYQEAVEQLLSNELAYPCSCSRAQIMKLNSHSAGTIIYPGTCRNKASSNLDEHSIRLRCNEKIIEFIDVIQGKQRVNLERSQGDFILQRRDGYFSYHLASGIDDAEQGITEVVRGADLLDCTPCQIHVQNILNLRSPRYCHLPIVVNQAGQKLSKQNHAKAIHADNAVPLLYQSLVYLGQSPPVELLQATPNEIWQWATPHWQLKAVPHENTCVISD